MKKYIKLLTILAIIFIGTAKTFAAISDTFTVIETQMHVAEVKASRTLLFTNGAQNGETVTIGNCIINFNAGAMTNDNDCTDDSATINDFDTATKLNTFFDSLLNVVEVDIHNDLDINVNDATHTQFITHENEDSDSEIYFTTSSANSHVTSSNSIPGVLGEPQILTFTPNNISTEGGITFKATLGINSYTLVTSIGDTIKNIVKTLQTSMTTDANFTCTENTTQIICTAINNQTNSFNAETIDTTSPIVSGNISINIEENATGIIVVVPNEVTITDADPIISYNINNTYKDHNQLTINSNTGEISFVNTPDFENPTDENNDNIYEIIVGIEDSTGNIHNIYVTITINNAINEVPIITSNGGGSFATINVAENNTTVTTILATDDDGDTLIYSITGGIDQNNFVVNNSTGVLTFITAPDFENPSDTDTNNTYIVEITVTDNGAGNLTVAQTITVNVTDINESTGHSRRFPTSHSNHRVCKDSRAINFSNAGEHDPSLCEYTKSKKNKKQKEILKKCLVIKTYNKLIKFGHISPAVKNLQLCLVEQGIDTGPIDGIFGVLTLKATKELQGRLGVIVDGIVGLKTRLAI